MLLRLLRGVLIRGLLLCPLITRGVRLLLRLSPLLICVPLLLLLLGRWALSARGLLLLLLLRFLLARVPLLRPLLARSLLLLLLRPLLRSGVALLLRSLLAFDLLLLGPGCRGCLSHVRSNRGCSLHSLRLIVLLHHRFVRLVTIVLALQYLLLLHPRIIVP